MTNLSKTFMIVGAIIFLIGFLMPYLHLGKLSGDSFIKGSVKRYCFYTLLIGAEGARLLREYGAGETPQALPAPRRLPGTPAESERLERRSTAKFN